MKRLIILLCAVLILLTGCGKTSADGTKTQPVQTPAEEDITGVYVNSVDDSTLSVTADADGSYSAVLSIFRLTCIDDFTGKYSDGVLTLTGTDAAGNPITMEVTFSDGEALMTFTDSTWQYLENGRQYLFSKE